jgi:hypothetical protein
MTEADDFSCYYAAYSISHKGLNGINFDHMESSVPEYKGAPSFVNTVNQYPIQIESTVVDAAFVDGLEVSRACDYLGILYLTSTI